MNFANLYDAFVNFGYLMKSGIPFTKKIRILLAFKKIYLKLIIINPLIKLKREKSLGIKFNAFDYGSLKFLYQEIFFRNEYYFYTNKSNPVILDCGANIGFATLYFKWLYPESIIYAFEPDRKTFEMLEKNVKMNKLKDVYLFNSAISDKAGEIDFYIDEETPGSLIMSTIKERMSKKKITVEAISLSNFIKQNNLKVDFAKIDVEGAEQIVIEDIEKNNIINKIDYFRIEYHHKITNQKSKLSEFLNIFERNGFEYQIDTRILPLSRTETFQDVLLNIYKND